MSHESDKETETQDSRKSGDEPADGHQGRRWLMVGVIVPITVALISAITVAVQHWITHHGGSEASTSTSASVAPPSASAGVVALPPADPIPAAWCFDCNPHLLPVARDCRDGSMHACDDLWKTVSDPKEEEPPAVHEYGLSCGGRRQLRSPGYQYKDCSDEFPGHN